MENRIFSLDSPKAIKADAYGYINAIHYMAPHTVAGVGNLCVDSTDACRMLCLGLTSGQAGMVHNIHSHQDQGNSVRKSRKAKARRFMRDRANYMRDMVRSIELIEQRAQRHGKQICFRLNGSTDIGWEGVSCERNGSKFRNVMAAFPHLQFVDYTKIVSRFKRALPANYHLTLSRSEVNEAQCVEALANGVNVAVVFGSNKPKQWHGFEVIDGDAHDLRHLDPRGARGVVVALSPKGRKAKRDKSGFVVRQVP